MTKRPSGPIVGFTMTDSNNTPVSDLSIRASLLDMGTLPRIPAPGERTMALVDECIAAIARCTTSAELDALRDAWALAGSVYRALCVPDRARVDAAGIAKRADLATLTDALTTIAADSARIASVPTREITSAPRRAQRRSQSAEAIAQATATARAAGARLAGYDGRVVDPGQGIGTVIAFGGALREYDEVSGRERQALIQWSAVERVRIAMNLPEKAFGRAPGLKGLLGQATEILNHGGYVARNVRAATGFVSAWKIGHFDGRIDSESMGRREALITLSADGALACDNPSHPGAMAVIADYERRVASTLIASDDLARRIVACLVNHYGARDTDIGLFVSPYHAARALDLVVALRPIAGRKIRAWAHTDRESMSDALADSFMLDLGALEREIASKASDLKRIAGASLIERIERLKAECNGLATVLGTENVEGFKARLNAADAAVTSALDSTALRAAQIELD